MSGEGNSGTTSSDAALIGQSLTEPEYFGPVVKRHVTPVFRYLASRVDRAEAEDLLADVFHAAFRSRQRYDQRHDDALPWLLGIATNVIRHHRRSEMRHSSMMRRMVLFQARSSQLAETADGVATTAELHDQMASLRHALARLDEKNRDVLVLAVGFGLSYEEIARALGIRTGTVRSRLSRGRARLRELLEADGQYRSYSESSQANRAPEERPQ